MKTSYATLLCVFLFAMSLNAQKTQGFSEKAKASFKKVTTPESTLRWMTIKEPEKVSKDLFLQKSKVIFDLDEKTTFKEIGVSKESQLSNINQGWKHYRLQQMYKGIPIEGAHYLLHEKNGLIETANGDVVAGLDINTMPSISEDAALQMLLDEIGANKYAWESKNQENLIKNQFKDQNATYFPKGELVIATTSEKLTAEDLTLGYKFKVKTIDPLSHAEYIVDAFTGNLIHKNSLLCQYDEQGTCQTHRYGQQTITTDYDNTNYRLTQSGRNIEMYNGNGDDRRELETTHFSNLTNDWSDPDHRSGCEAYWALEQTYDYFQDRLNWKGHDNNGSELTVWVNVKFEEDPSNAMGGGGAIYLGEGDGINYGPFTAIDIVAHEFAHNVIESSGTNLQYRGESGALNESFADIFGTAVEFYAEPNINKRDWLLGEDISLAGNAGAIRDMSNPTTKGHPATYEDDNWRAIANNCHIKNDYCHVHKNSGVQNHWFYILSNGKADTNYHGYTYNVSGIGMTKAVQLAFENLKNYLVPFSHYMDARNGSMEAANALGFDADETNQVKEAWCAVGLGNCNINTTGTITITSPNGGESLNQGIPTDITWTKEGITGTEVKIEYSVSGGSQWHLISDVADNSGSYQWIPPSVATYGALIRVSSISNPTIYDSSDDHFSITTCDINADFEISNVEPCANETVVFTSTSTGANTNKWYSNGAFIYDGPIFNHTFTQNGYHEVELRSSNGSGCGDVKTFSVFVQPTANANFTYNVVLGSISFMAPDNASSTTYLWTTGDGGSYDTPNIGKTYSSAGIYTVCLEINSSCGSDSYCEDIQANVLGCTDVNACNYNSNANIGDGNCIYGNCNNCLESDSLALVALYNATDGPNWFNTWDLSQPVNTWYGISISGCHIYTIDLVGNNLSGPIPPEIGNLQNLYYFFLQDNSLSGPIPVEIGNLQNVIYLYLHHNDLSGTIPVEVGNLQNLVALSMPGNSLSGEIPKEIGNLQNLRQLQLHDNNLSGSIPIEIGNLRNLVELHLYENNLSGPIPSEIGNLQNLVNLALYENDLSGVIPIEIGNLQSLEYLNIYDNNLSGSIPNEIGNLQSLYHLSFSINNLSGIIPNEITNLQNLKFLNLHDNNLSGSIPNEIVNLQNLEYLALSYNNLLWTIPSEIENLQSLYYLALEANILSGPIPSEIGNLQNLEILSFAENNLSGPIPSEIGNLQNLTTLHLYDNILSGCYPTSLCDLALNVYSLHGNLGLPNSGYDPSFQDFCNGIAPPCTNESETEVYPGDLNFDGVANYKDILSFGLYNGEFGLSRENQGINWYGHSSIDWGVVQENGEEIKHIDADGNGVIDLNDVGAIEENYGATHTANNNTLPSNYNNHSPIEIDLEEYSFPSFIGGDDQLILDITIEDIYGGELSLYGGYFSIYYDPEWVNDIEVVLEQSWFGTPDQNVEYITYNDTANNKIDIGFTKVDRQNSIGKGFIGQVKTSIVSVNNDTPWDTTGVDLGFSVSEILMQDAKAFALPIGTSTIETTVTVFPSDCELSQDCSGSELSMKVLLQGAYDSITQTMSTFLTEEGSLPLSQPYGLPSEGTETIDDMPQDVVDWILIEIRDKDDYTQVIFSKAALLLKDGTVVDIDGISNVSLDVSSGEYYVSVSHRNHLNIMTAEPVLFNNNQVNLDFTNPVITPTYGQNIQKEINGIYTMWAGDLNNDGKIIFQGVGNELNDFFFRIIDDPNNTYKSRNFILSGYSEYDLDFDNQAIYQGLDNDVNTIFFNVIEHPDNTTLSRNYIITNGMQD